MAGPEAQANIKMTAKTSTSEIVERLNRGAAMGICDTLLVFAIVAGLEIGFCLVFTMMGLGHLVFSGLYPLYHIQGFPMPLPHLLVFISLVIMLAMYLLDQAYWHSTGCGYLKTLIDSSVGILLIIAGVFAAKRYPASTLMIFAIGVPFVVYLVRKFILYKRKLSSYMKVLAWSLIIVGLGILIYFIIWISAMGWFYDAQIKQQIMIDMEYIQPNGLTWEDEEKCSFNGCEEDAKKYMCTTNDGCQNSHYGAFLIWVAPFLMSFGSMGFGGICLVTAIMIGRPDAKKGKMMVNILGGAFVALTFAVWCAASIAGAASNLSEIVIAGAGATFIFTCVMIGSIMGFDTLKRDIADMGFVKNIGNHWAADWMKAMALLTCWWIIPIVLLLSALNQCFRKLPCITCTKNIQHTPGEMHSKFTEVVEKGFESIGKWNFTSVYVKLIWLGGIFYGMQVGVAKITNVFLSWLIESLSDLDLVALTLVFMVVGACMFLLPPVPGPPVYLTGGVLVTQKATVTFGGDSYFFLAIFYVTVVCLGIKLVACSLQQKVIGEKLGDKVGVRAAIGVNSLTIRAIRRVLMEKGLSLGKVCILCAGPDWPTSVLTGILKCKWSEMMIGTIPVYFLIVPMVVTGAFQLKASEGGLWAAMGQIIVMASGIIVGSAMFMMVYIINKTSVKYKKELEAEAPDEAVAELDAKAAIQAELRLKCTTWGVLPVMAKMWLAMAAFAMALSFAMFNFGACFRPFVITSKIGDPYELGGLNGNVLNLLTAQGVVAHIMFIASIMCFKVFGCQASSLVKAGEQEAEAAILESGTR